MLAIHSVHRRFGSLVALDDVSFSLARGEAVGFIGRNGAGKTTTMRVILGLLSADSGSVLWDEKPIARRDRTGIGYMPEERGLYAKMAVRDQLEYFAQLSGCTRTDAVLNVKTLLDQLGVTARASDRLERLSLGNQQRVQLAAALVGNPKLLVLDEPFSGLDPVGIDVLAKVLGERISSGTPVLFSSHQLELVEQLCHRVVMIEKGHIVRDESIRNKDNVATFRLVMDASVTRRQMEGLAHLLGEMPQVKTAHLIDDSTCELVFDHEVTATNEVLAPAMGVGPVISFAPYIASLADRFRGSLDPVQSTGEPQLTTEGTSRWGRLRRG
jgi:ABC-2 type transport system ATP-binding protein